MQGFSKIVILFTLMLTTISSPANVKTPLKATRNSTYMTFKAKLAFLQLREAFIKFPIVHYFDPERYIQIKIDSSCYAIVGILSQLTPESGQ